MDDTGACHSSIFLVPSEPAIRPDLFKVSNYPPGRRPSGDCCRYRFDFLVIFFSLITPRSEQEDGSTPGSVER